MIYTNDSELGSSSINEEMCQCPNMRRQIFAYQTSASFLRRLRTALCEFYFR